MRSMVEGEGRPTVVNEPGSGSTDWAPRTPLHRPAGGPPRPAGEEMVASRAEAPMDAPRATIIRARQLRRALTPPEARLWVALRTRPGGLKFRRQHPVGPLVLDFYCDAALLAIEVDGAVHDTGDNPARDRRRDAWLERQGIAVLRIPAEDVRRRLDDVIDTILAAASERLPSPPPQGEGDRPQGGGGGARSRIRRT